ncbi:MAG: hypothetical protein ACHREM_10590 [Polyangiales bacterium]
MSDASDRTGGLHPSSTLDLAAWVAVCAIAGGSISSLCPRVRVWSVLAAATASGALAMAARARFLAPPTTASAVERWAPLAVILFFAPCLWFTTPPGADMTMHVAMARAIATGSAALSPAYGDLVVVAYPRGLPAWIAVLSAPFGLALAGLIANGVALSLYTLGLRAFARDVLRLPFPGLIALVATIASKSPQGFLTWGGAPNLLALTFGLFAAAHVARGGLDRAGSSALLGSVLLVAAVATHPMGALCAALFLAIGVTCVIGQAPAETRAHPAGAAALACAFLPFLAALLWLSARGPSISEAERQWIADFSRVDSRVVPGPRSHAAFEIFHGIWSECGPVYLLLWLASCAALIARRSWRIPLASLASIEIVGLVLANGPYVPGIGPYLYPARFAPLLSIAMMLPIAQVTTLFDPRSHCFRFAVALTLFAGLGVHVDLTDLTLPIATKNDLAAIACLDRTVPSDAVIDGRYGDATAWIPALTGRRVTRPHVHCTLLDEVAAIRAHQRPTYRFVGERQRYVDGAEAAAMPRTQPVCVFGGAALYPIESMPRVAP